MNFSLNNTALFFSIFFSLVVSSQQIYPRQYLTSEINSINLIEIDGYINEDEWNKVLWGDDFIEVSPDENTAPAEQTKFKILYDQKYLYVSIMALDSNPKSITSRLSRRDGFEGDSITNITLDFKFMSNNKLIYSKGVLGSREFISNIFVFNSCIPSSNFVVAIK